MNHSSLKTISLFLLFNFKSTYCCRIRTKISFYTKIWTPAGYVKVSARNKILLTLKLQEISTFIHGSSVRSLLLFLPKLIERSFVKLLHYCFHAKRQEWMVFCHFFVYLTENVESMVQTHEGDLGKPFSGNKIFFSKHRFKNLLLCKHLYKNIFQLLPTTPIFRWSKRGILVKLLMRPI